MNAVLGSKPLYVYTHACTSAFPSIKWGATCSACSSNSRGKELGSAMDLDVEGPLQGPTLLGNSTPRSTLQGQPFCSVLMHSLLQVACSVPTQVPGPPLHHYAGGVDCQGVHQLPWKIRATGLGSKQAESMVVYVSAEEPEGVPMET